MAVRGDRDLDGRRPRADTEPDDTAEPTSSGEPTPTPTSSGEPTPTPTPTLLGRAHADVLGRADATPTSSGEPTPAAQPMPAQPTATANGGLAP